MAKKHRKDREEEKYEFTPPPFDKKEHMRKEVKKAKAAVVTIIYAVVVSIGSFGLALAGEPGLGAILGFAGLALIRFVYLGAQVDISVFDWKDWAGNGFIYFFSWLGIWVLLMNPPFSDFAHPSIEKIEVYGWDQEHNVTVLYKDTIGNDSNSHFLINAGEDVNVTARVTDNVDLSSVTINVTVDGKEFAGSVVDKGHKDHEYTWEIQQVRITGNSTVEVYEFTIFAEDVNGNSYSQAGSFEVRQ